MHSIKTIIALFFFIYMCSLMTPCNRTLWYGQYTRGSSTPQYGVRSLNTFTSAAPRTYSIICISSESCLWSIVGFARLPCFGTLHSAISAKVALGELLWLCPGSAGLSTSVEKAKTDHHDEARAGRYSRGFRVPKDLCRLERGTGLLSGPGVDSAPNSVFRTLGASPKFEIIEFYG